MKKILIITAGFAILLMYSCGTREVKNDQIMEYHRIMYFSTTHLTLKEHKELINYPREYDDLKTYITRIQANGHDARTPPMMFKWDNQKKRYVFAFVLHYNPKLEKEMCRVDRELYFPSESDTIVEKWWPDGIIPN